MHIAYATSSDGSAEFSTSWFSGATYIGIKSDNTKADPTYASSYEWSLIKGADGKNGKDGHSPIVAATKSGEWESTIDNNLTTPATAPFIWKHITEEREK